MSLFTAEIISATLVLIFVIGLILLLFYGIRRLGLAGPVTSHTGEKRLNVVEVLQIDARRRLVLVRRDDAEHLILLGLDGDRVVESGIDASFRAKPPSRMATFGETLGKLSANFQKPGGLQKPSSTSKGDQEQGRNEE